MAKKCPSYEEAVRLIDETEMLSNIIDHSFLVKTVSEIIMKNMKHPESIDHDLVIISALLHDITKTRSLQTKENHAQTGAEMLEAMGFPDVAEIIRNHVFLQSIDLNTRLSESEIVHYADKRVKHGSIVTLTQRIDDLIERYGTSDEVKSSILERISFLTLLEQKIKLNLVKDIETDLYKLNEK